VRLMDGCVVSRVPCTSVFCSPWRQHSCILDRNECAKVLPRTEGRYATHSDPGLTYRTTARDGTPVDVAELGVERSRPAGLAREASRTPDRMNPAFRNASRIRDGQRRRHHRGKPCEDLIDRIGLNSGPNPPRGVPWCRLFVPLSQQSERALVAITKNPLLRCL
jgi:hypothetical protein